jgi:hypothetical protein
MKINFNHLIALIWAFLISFLWLFTMYSCSIEHHLSKAQKHIDIAKQKGAVIKPDTVWQYNYTKETIFDTITNTYKEVLKKDSTATTINNNIIPGMSRQEKKALDSYYKHLEKMMRLQNDSLSKQLRTYIKANKQENKTERITTRIENKQPWAWVIFAILILIIILVFKKIFKL